jgi:hypothetical protein
VNQLVEQARGVEATLPGLAADRDDSARARLLWVQADNVNVRRDSVVRRDVVWMITPWTEAHVVGREVAVELQVVVDNRSRTS